MNYFGYNIQNIVSPNFYFPGQDCSFTGMELWNGMWPTNYGILYNNTGSLYL